MTVVKRLQLLRHAKSSWSEPGVADIDRPLNDRGLRNAPKMGERLVARAQVPELIVSSPARRALATAQLVADACGIARAAIEVVDALYEAGTDTWLRLISELPRRTDRVLMVGHNPAITDLAHLLCEEARIDNVPTCGLLVLDYDLDAWTAVALNRPAAWLFDYPKRPFP